MGYLDLHVHSKYSDGKCEVKEILDMALANNVSVLSLTEHYNISSLRVARKFVKSQEKYQSIEIIPGIEIGASMLGYGLSNRHICHILAYFVSTKIYPILNEYEEDRRGTDERIILALRNQGIDITFGKVRTFSKKKSFGRYDIAKYLVKKGYAYTPEDAYAKYLDYGQMGHIDRKKMSPEELVKKIVLCGGVPVIAHPKSIRLNYSDFCTFIEPLIEVGLAGIEVNYPRLKEEEYERYNEICKEYKLIETTGSDFHRIGDDVEIGLGINNNMCVEDYSAVRSLKEIKHQIDNHTYLKSKYY